MVEYAVLLTFFACPVCVGMTMAGQQMLDGYVKTRKMILAPNP